MTAPAPALRRMDPCRSARRQDVAISSRDGVGGGVECGAPAAAQTKLLRFPDIHGDRVVFSYAGDLWTASTGGGTASRLTAHPGLELFPRFSPDGSQIAFTGQYDGDEQVYVVPASGGVPRQLTYYPARGPLAPRWGYDNQVYDWSPDGRAVLFRSLRYSTDLSDSRLFLASVDGGLPIPLAMPESGAGDLSPDGSRVVYSPLFRDFRTWKRYEGGWAQELYIFDRETHVVERITSHRRADRDPMWIGDAIYFTSDRDGTLNLYRYDLGSRETTQLTDSDTWDVRWPGDDGVDRIVYELNGELQIYSLDEGHVARHRHHRAGRRAGEAAVARRRGGPRRGLGAQPEGRAGALRGPRRRLQRPDRERTDPQPDAQLVGARQVGALVARRPADCLRFGRDRRGRDLPHRPGRLRGAGATHDRRAGDALCAGVVARREAPRLQRQGRQAVRARRRDEGRHRRRRRAPRRAARLRLVAPRRLPRLLDDRPERVQLHLGLEPRRPRAAPDHGRPLPRVEPGLGPGRRLPLLPLRPAVRAAARVVRVELPRGPRDRDLRPRPAQGRAPSAAARERRGGADRGG